jgi:hypothetical protein
MKKIICNCSYFLNRKKMKNEKICRYICILKSKWNVGLKLPQIVLCTQQFCDKLVERSVWYKTFYKFYLLRLYYKCALWKKPKTVASAKKKSYKIFSKIQKNVCSIDFSLCSKNLKGIDDILKFRFCKKATKSWQNLPVDLSFTYSKHEIIVEISSNFWGLLRKLELSRYFRYPEK